VEYGLLFRSKSQERKSWLNTTLTWWTRRRVTWYPRQLSGGMRKRVDVARAIATGPEVLLMDEPFAALDVLTKQRLQEEFLNIWSETRMTVVFVTHDLEEALYLSDRVVVMSTNPGRVNALVDVPFTRPRDPDLKTIPEFQEMRRELSHILLDKKK
jgi:NitT/TauT family transport system ATP-binding protein